MPRRLIPRFVAALEVSQLDDVDLHELVATIQQASTTSPLVLADPLMGACVAILTSQDAALTEAGAAVVASRAQLQLDLTAEVRCRNDLGGVLRTYASMTSSHATSLADVQGTGLPPRAPAPRRRSRPDAPGSIDTRYPLRGHGKATVSVHESGTARRQYVAECSPDPFDDASWAPLGVSRGKTRILTGPSGSRVWVRFATVRGDLQSDWCTPVLVTLP